MSHKFADPDDVDSWTDGDDTVESEEEVAVKSDSEDEGDSGIEAKPEPDPPILKVGRPRKPRPPLTQKQLDALAKGRQKRDAGRAERKAVADEKKAIRKANLEKRTIKKAVSLKKKEALEEAALMLSDDDSGDELEVKMVKRLVAKRKAAAKAKPKAKAKPRSPSPSPPRRTKKTEPVAEASQFVFY